MRVVVADSGPLIALSRVHHLDVLPALYGQVFITAVVRDELMAFGTARFKGQADLRQALQTWLQVAELPSVGAPTLHPPLNPNLDAGERSSILLCLQTPDSLLIVDDQAARQEAAAQGLTFVGLVGVLIQAKHRGLVVTLAPLLGAVREAGYFLSDAVVFKALDMVGESA